jgi:hypothetical protein
LKRTEEGRREEAPTTRRAATGIFHLIPPPGGVVAYTPNVIVAMAILAVAFFVFADRP